MTTRFRDPYHPGAVAVIALQELSMELEATSAFVTILRTVADQLSHPERWQGTSAGEADGTDGVWEGIGEKMYERL